MKKLLAVLLSAALLLSLAGCNQEPETTTGATTAETTVYVPDTTAAPETTAPAKGRENKLVYATAAQFNGDFAVGLFAGTARDIVGGNAADALSQGSADQVVGDLLMDCGIFALQQDGTYAYNMTVLAKTPTVTENADGTRTYTMEIKPGLQYNTGKAITAKDYIFRTLFVNSTTCVTLGGHGYDGTDYPSGAKFYRCETEVFSDIRLLGDYAWSVTVSAENASYYFAERFVEAQPWDVEYWLGTGYSVADNGQGCYLTKDGKAVMMDVALADTVSAHFASARSGKVLPMVTAGPYQLSAYDEASKTVTLTRNPNYAGNFEGQLPSIETLEITNLEESKWETALKDGAVHLVDTAQAGSTINTLLELTESGADLLRDEFDRAGYGKLQFVCDITPTQFVEVRQAIAQLVDRRAMVDLHCQGWGSVINGPYSNALWMARESDGLFDQTLKRYDYSEKAAEKALDQGGWVYDEWGDPWTGDGLRYKEVTDEQAEYMDECIQVGDKTLMPLIIKWAATENNSVTSLLKVLLAESEAVEQQGMEIQVEEMDFASMLGYLYRQDIYGVGGDFDEPEYSMFNLAAGFPSARYDYAYSWSGDDSYVAAGYNSNYLYDLEEGGLDKLSMKMVYGVKQGDRAGYLKAWQDYVVRYNALLPDLPLYVNHYATFYVDWLENYDQDTFWGFQNAVLYASIADAE